VTVAKPRQKSTAESKKPAVNHGGKRPGAGRKTKEANKIREDFNSVINQTVGPWVLELLTNLKTLAGGIKVRDDEGVIFDQPPDRAAAIYLIDRLVGKPFQSVKLTGDEGDPLKVSVTYANDRDQITEAASGPTEGAEGDEAV
jgi:hypothetical protein